MNRVARTCAGGLLAAAVICGAARAEPDEGSHGAPAAVAATTPAEHAEAHHGSGHEVAPAPGRVPMPFDIIRTLQFLQDQIAQGNGRAIRVQAMLLRRFGPVFAEADPATWSEPRNRRAAILFALSGGPPDTLRRLLAAGAFDAATQPIAEGALAYVSNDLPKAEKLLSAVDFATTEPALSAHLNLVLAQIRQSDRPADAIGNLGQARLLAPGGLIEEAALRLEVVLAEKLGDAAGADRSARQYFDRFARSAYAGNFLARFAMVHADRASADPAASLAAVLGITARLDPASRRALLLAISRRSLVAGKLEFARLAGTEALRVEGIAGEERQRGNLYAAAAGLVAAYAAGTAGELREVDRTLLHPADVGLLDAATSVLAHLEEPPAEPTTTDAAPLEASPVLDRAQKLLDAVAGDLGASE